MRLSQTEKSPLAAAIAYAERNPGKVLFGVLAIHLVVWTVLPILLCPNLQLDLAEDLALGKEWQLGYWKHPPLPWWLADLGYRLTGSIDSVYVLGPLAAVICLWGVWLLARDMVGGFMALIAVLVLEGIHYYNFSVIKFAHDQMQLPFWAFTALFFHRALTRGNAVHWLLAGAMLAGAFWSKYAAFALAATLGLFLLLDPVARRAWRTPGPWLMALAFAVVIAPNVWWLFNHEFMPFQYVDARAKLATRWYDYILFPLRWAGGQLFFITTALALLSLLYWNGERTPRTEDESAAFNRRYVAALALGPFLVTTLVATLLGRLPVAMWGYPLWSFAPLAVLMWWPVVVAPRTLRRFAAAFVAVFVAFPVAYAAIEEFESSFRDRPKATQFPGEVMAEALTRAWRESFGTPLVYVGGGEFATNNVAVYSPDRPHVIVHGDLRLSPWIDRADLARRGALLVWEAGQIDVARLRSTFPDLEVQSALILARQTRRPVAPVRVEYAFVRPRP